MPRPERRNPSALRRYPATVRAAERPSPTLLLLHLELAPGTRFPFEPGQFTYLLRSGSDERRAYSIASAPHEERRIDLAIQRLEEGPMTEFLHGLAPGQTVELTQAFGSFRFDSRPGQPVLFICTETGIAPLRSILRDLHHKRDARPMTLLQGAAKSETLPFHKEFEALARDRPNLRYRPFMDAPAADGPGERGPLLELVRSTLATGIEVDVYLAGLKSFVDAMVQGLTALGIPASRIRAERFA